MGRTQIKGKHQLFTSCAVSAHQFNEIQQPIKALPLDTIKLNWWKKCAAVHYVCMSLSAALI